MKTLIDHACILTMDEAKIYPSGCLVVEDNLIRYVGESQEWEESFDQVIDARGGVVMPGLVNGHTHSPMSLLRGCGNDLALDEWLTQHIFPLEDQLDDEAVYYGTMLSCAEMIRSGTTAFADMYFFCDSIARAVLDAGMNCNLSRCVTGMNNDYKKRLAEARDLFAAYHGAGDGRIKVEHSAHAVYTCSREVIRAVVEAAQEDGTGIHIHLSETMKENRDCYRKYGKSPTEVFHELGVFSVRTNAAHCVYLSENDMDIMKRHDVSVSHNPTSNLKLASGVANVKELLEKEINVSLGTDGAASNNSLDMFSEMKMAALLHKGMRLDSKLIPAQTALLMATVNGAKTLGRENEIGALKPGYRADLIILDPDSPAIFPLNHPETDVVYGSTGGQVLTVMIGGQLVMKDREFLTIDMEKVKHGVMQASRRMGII